MFIKQRFAIRLSGNKYVVFRGGGGENEEAPLATKYPRTIRGQSQLKCVLFHLAADWGHVYDMPDRASVRSWL